MTAARKETGAGEGEAVRGAALAVIVAVATRSLATTEDGLKKKTRHGETSVVLTPPTRSRERDSGANRGVTEVSLSESAESEESQDEDESVQPASSRTAASEPKEAEASKPEGHKNAPPVPPAPSRLSGSEPPPEPKDPPKGKPGPRTKPKGKVGNDADKCSSYKCENL